MSLLPFVLNHPFSRNSWWDTVENTPSRIFDQHFGIGLCDEDLYPAQTSRGLYLRPRRALVRQKSGMSEVINDNEKFQASLEVGPFAPDELTVKTVDKAVVIHGKHEEKNDDFGFVSREFTRRYVLPADSKPEDVTCEMSSDGRLVITAPKRPKEMPKIEEREVPIGKQQVSSPKL